ncbi:MAG: hypothetical protein ACLFR0_03555 [Alphaproteobacteria bacterium]
MPQLEEQTRRDIAAFLPEAIETALESYRSFAQEQATSPVSSEDVEVTEKFKKHHDACKVAIAHIKLLIDLAKWADLPDARLADEKKHKHLLSLLSVADNEIKEKCPE